MYFVKVVNRATKNNPNFAGDVCESLYGKNQTLVAMCGNHAERLYTTQKFIPFYAKQFGYKRASDARRSYMFKCIEDERFWDTEVSIVEIDC